MSAPGLALEARVAALERLLPGLRGDQLTPNNLSVAADGSIVGTFSGIILPAYSGSPAPANEIAWETVAGVPVAEIDASATGMDVKSTSTGPLSQLNVVATAAGGGNAFVNLLGSDNGPAQPSRVIAEAISGATGFSRTVIDSDENSDFVQSLATGQLFIDGPIGLAIPAIAAGNAAGVNFNTTRTAWTSAGFACTPGRPLFVTGTYNGGSSWTATFWNPWGSTQPANNGVIFVIGF